MRRNWVLGVLVAMAAWGAMDRVGKAYIEAAYTLGKIIQDSTNIVLVRVVSVDRDKNTITYKKVEDIKGTYNIDEIKQNIAHAGFNPREWQNVMAWAAEGKLAVMCHNGAASETCIDNYWFQCYVRKGDPSWWDMYHGEPFLLRSFAGKPATMAAAVKQIMKGAEVIVPCMVDGDKNALALRTARFERLRASMKLQDYNEARDFAGWGGDQIRPVLDMAGFEQISTLPHIDGAGGWGVATGHLQGENRTDLVLFSEDRVTIMQNEGEGSFAEATVEGKNGDKVEVTGARAAAVADYNGTGRGSVILASPGGPRLLTGLGVGRMRDDSDALPQRPYWGLTAAAWVDMGDKDRPAILLADAYGGLRLLRNNTAAAKVADTQPAAPLAQGAGGKVALAAASVGTEAGKPDFADVSDAAGVGEHGLGAGMAVKQLLVANLFGNGAPAVIVNGQSEGHVLVLGIKDARFVEMPGTGLSWPAGAYAVAGDLDGDGKIDVLATGPGGTRVWKNQGNGRFADITRASGLGGIFGASAVLVPRFDGVKSVMDVLVGCVGSSNRYFRNDGRGRFTEMTEQIGLGRRIFNSRAVAVLPATPGRIATADLVMVNEGQNSAVLIWKQ